MVLLAGADSGDIAVPIDDGSSGDCLDLDGVVGVFEFALGFALGDFLLKQAWPCGAGAEREAEDEERGFHSVCGLWLMTRQVMDLTYPARREVFFVAVEREETKLSDALRVLAPVMSGDWAFPCSSASLMLCTASAMMALRLVFKRLSLRFISITFASTQSRNSCSMEMVNLTALSFSLMP